MNSDPVSTEPRAASQWTERLCSEQRLSWECGHRIPVETYLSRYADLLSDSEALLDVIYNEIVLRDESGEPASREEYVARFPGVSDQLHRLFDVHEIVASDVLLTSAGTSARPDISATNAAAPRGSNSSTTRIATYEILEEIGRGGMGIVYKARQFGTDRLVALKVILAGRFASGREISRFHTEAQAAARLDHPGIVPIYEIGQADDLYYLSMAYVEGETLAAILVRGPLAPRRAATMIRDVAEAVHAAHARNIIHRDLKPQNILVDTDAQVRITDFGLALQNDQDAHLTSTGQIVGTPQYMAPEQAEGRQNLIGPSTDIYALGATLYCALTGRPPFDGAVAIEVLNRIIQEEPVSPRLLNPSAPRDLETICLKCLQKEPHRRYSSAHDLAADLQRFLVGEPITASPIGRLGRLWRWCRRQPMLAGMSALIFSLLAALIVGSAAAAHRLKDEHARTLQHLQRAERAETLANSRLLESLIARVRTERRSGQMGQRLESLAAIAEASRLAGELAARPETILTLRNEAVACLILTDVEPVEFPDVPDSGVACRDPSSERDAWWDADSGSIVVRSAREGRRHLPFSSGGEELVELRFSRTGQFLAARMRHDDGEALVLWNLFRPEKQHVALKPPAGRIVAFDFAADEKIAIVLRAHGPALLFRTDSGELECSIDTGGPASGCCVHAGSHRMAVWHGADVCFIDLADGRTVGRLSHPGGARVQSGAWSPDGELFATGTSDHNAYVWDVVEKPGLRAILMGHEAWVREVAFRPQGDVLMTASLTDRTTCLWDPRKGTQLVRFDGSGRSFSTGGDRLFGSLDGRPAQWRVVADVITRSFVGASPSYPAIQGALCRNDRLLVTCGWNDLRLWDFRTGRELTQQETGRINSMRVMPDRRSVATCGESGLQIWPITCDGAGRWHLGSPRNVPVPQTTDCLQDLSVDSHGRIAAVGHGLAFVARLDQQKPADPLLHHLGATRCEISPDGHWLTTSGGSALGLRVWAAGSHRLVRELSADREETFAAFSPDGSVLFGGAPNSYCFWTCGSWECIRRVPRGVLDQPVVSAAFSPDGGTFATSDRLRQIRLFETETGKELVTLPARHYATWICFTSDGLQLICLDEVNGIQVWDLRRLREELSSYHIEWSAKLES